MADNDHDQTWAKKISGMCNRVQDPKNVVQILMEIGKSCNETYLIPG